MERRERDREGRKRWRGEKEMERGERGGEGKEMELRMKCWVGADVYVGK